jgi:CRISPR-associated protein Cmr5
MKTRSQEELEQAARLVTTVKDRSEELSKIYGGLCHSFPVLVIQCGLAQSLLFHESKAGNREKPREQAHELLLVHIADVLGVSRPDLIPTVMDIELTGYMNFTRQILSAWVFFKRFAISILGVQSGEVVEEGGSHASS